MALTAIAVTFGSDHTHPEISDKKLADGYMVVEAPTYEIARNIAFAITGGVHAFDYPLEEHLAQEKVHEWYPLGELLRIKWGSTSD